MSVLTDGTIASDLEAGLRGFDLLESMVLRQDGTDHPCEGWRDRAHDADTAFGSKHASTRAVVYVLKSTLAVAPYQGDKLDFADPAGRNVDPLTDFTIIDVEIDAAGAVWRLEVA